MLDKMNAAICARCEAAVPVAEMDEHGNCSECVRAISRAKTIAVERLAIARAERDHHEYMMRTDWIYWICKKIGIKPKEGSDDG